ncbi:TAP-like protein-domain-containing protein [Phellopilus nigrolimitatus]|nr:TAP-like protein-domain-containing protein [Phellopilus nigrolimitatus]
MMTQKSTLLYGDLSHQNSNNPIFREGKLRWTRKPLYKLVLLAVAFLLIIVGTPFKKWSDHHGRLATNTTSMVNGEAVVTGAKGTIQEFNWTSIVPAEKLECNWTTTLRHMVQVPLDYAEPSVGHAAIAIVKYPSMVLPGEGNRGPILFNPGGPGGSGVQTILTSAQNFRDILGDDYDLIGFDPRGKICTGIGFTTPGLLAFQVKNEANMFYINAFPTVNSSLNAIASLHGNARVLGDVAKSRIQSVAEHVSTPVVARDMLSIVKAHGKNKLQYWGFSYGTNNIERVILDGVVDSENYYSGNVFPPVSFSHIEGFISFFAVLWSNNLRDTDAVLENLYRACVDAGPLTCTIYENSTEKIHDRIENILQRLRVEPVTFFNETTGAYGIVDYSVAKHAIFSTMYRTHARGRDLVSALADLEKGIGEPIYKLSSRSSYQSVLSDSSDCPTTPPTPFAQGMENLLAIACGDGSPVDDNAEELQKYYDTMAKDSSFAECWFIRTGCSGWKITGKERFTGSFEANTSFPLLLVGNTADPVTPLNNAHRMSKGFDSPGHCSTSATSLCTAKAIRAYFRNGTLPEKGTVCDVESSIFGNDLSLNVHSLSVEDQQLLRASRSLESNYFVPTL